MVEARANWRKFQGTSHRLHSAIVLAENGRIIWRHSDHADLTMRPLFQTHFEQLICNKVGVDECGPLSAQCAGIQLFQKSGDYFTNFGLPLLPLLAESSTAVVGT